MWSLITGNSLLALFTILITGSLIGSFSIGGISLGTAGVLLIALIFGHFGITIPKEIMDMGLLLFVYAVGLQAGPRFFRTFKRNGIVFLTIGIVSLLVTFVSTIVVARIMGLSYDLATGLFTGAVTNTPALAAAIDLVSHTDPVRVGNISVGYGVAYPFSVIGVTLLIQILPKILRTNISKEEHDWFAAQQMQNPSLLRKHFVVTNANCFNKTLSRLPLHDIGNVNISRLYRKGQFIPATPKTTIKENDIVTVVGLKDELEKIQFVLGKETDLCINNTTVMSEDVEMVTSSLGGKTLAQLQIWETYGVTITRIKRQDMELAPRGQITLEMGDILRVVGERDAVEEFAKVIGSKDHKTDETQFIPFFIGIVSGIIIGSVPLILPNGLSIKLGTAGGVFIASLVLGHFGRIGSIRLYVPQGAKNFARELGLMIFLAGAGTSAGAKFVSIVQQHGVGMLFAGAIITTLTVLTALVLMLLVFRMQTLPVLGSLSALMTNPPALGAAKAQSTTDIPTLYYASVYPVALIFKIILVQVLMELLMVWH